MALLPDRLQSLAAKLALRSAMYEQLYVLQLELFLNGLGFFAYFIFSPRRKHAESTVLCFYSNGAFW